MKKYLVLLCDGMSDLPVPELGGKTPMSVARKPYMDFLARRGITGVAGTLPEGMPTGSDVANLSILGYDPKIYHTGRSPIEAVAMGIEMKDTDMAFRCNLVTLSVSGANGSGEYEDKIMSDYSAGEIDTFNAAELIHCLGSKLNNEHIKLYSGVSYRHCMINEKPFNDYTLTPPHDILGKHICDYMPEGPGAAELIDLMKQSYAILSNHPINKRRESAGLNPANSIWLWGEGKKMTLIPFKQKFGVKASVVSAVDLIKGIAKAADMKYVSVEGATGNFNTNYKGKALAALNELDNGQDFVFIHVEAPDECGHQGDVAGKIRSIEKIDSELLATLIDGLKKYDDYNILIAPDHSTPLCVRTHTREPVPWLFYKSMNEEENKFIAESNFNEVTAKASGIFIEGTECMEMLVEENKSGQVR